MCSPSSRLGRVPARIIHLLLLLPLLRLRPPPR
eukprot:COSAG04_NODE_26838_length_290_cov_0.806283_1_plen_32_part_10